MLLLLKPLKVILFNCFRFDVRLLVERLLSALLSKYSFFLRKDNYVWLDSVLLSFFLNVWNESFSILVELFSRAV